MSLLAQTRAVACWTVALAAMLPAARGQTVWRDGGVNPSYRILQHARLADGGPSVGGCEWFQMQLPGAPIYLARDIARPSVIEELALSLWVKSDRPGVQLAVWVVLPRTADPRTGRPLVTTLNGTTYTDVGRWQRLRLSGLPTLLTRQLHALRMEHGPQVDGREAYVEALLLNVFGHAGTVNLWIGEIEAAGQATVSPGATAPVRLPPVDGPGQAGMVPVVPQAVAAPRRVVKLTGSVLMVDGRPMFPRVIQHCGEPLAYLKQCGFNAVWMRRLPSPEVVEEAQRLGLWLICPPPQPAQTPMVDIPPAFDAVLAWDLDAELIASDLERTQQWADQIKTADRRGNRPLICCPRGDFRGYSRAVDLLLIDRRPLGTSLSMTDYAAWVHRQPLLARPGTPIWTTVQTQPNEALRRQLTSLEPSAAAPKAASPEQIQLLVYTAVAAGSRGLLFLSDSPLDAQDPWTRQRAMTLQWLNLELELIDPWAAAGQFVATAESNLPEVQGTLLRTDRARLLLPIWSAPGAQCVPPQSAANAVALVAPGVPEACNAYELTPGGAKSLHHQRVAGGMSVKLDEFGITARVLLAQDPLIVASAGRRGVEVGRRTAELERHLAARKLETVESIAGRLASDAPASRRAEWIETARNHLQACDAQLASGDILGASQHAQRAMRSLRLVERTCWDVAVRGLASPVSSPGAVGFDTLPWHWRLVDRLAKVRFGPNRVAGGDFEDIETMMRAGWRHTQQAVPNVQTAADLAPGAARSGRLGLRLAAVAAEPNKAPAALESPPVLFTSPPVQIEAGQILCVHGWVRVPRPITAGADGLLIVDSLAGEALADRVGQTEGWRQFALYRAAPQSGPMCVTFALGGLGEAHIDDVAIQVVE